MRKAFVELLAVGLMAVLVACSSDKSAPTENTEPTDDLAAAFARQIGFTADTTVAWFPREIAGIVFDTSLSGAIPDTGDWHYFGPLRVDSIVLDGYAALPLVSPDQIEGLRISSEDLLYALRAGRIRRLVKQFPGKTPEDVNYYDPISGEWKTLPDLSKYYLGFSVDSAAVDSAIGLLRAIPGVDDVHRAKPPIQDGGD